MTRRPFRTKAYRYPRERFILALTLFAVLLVIAITATATVCLSFIFIVAMVALSYAATRSHHRSLMEQAVAVSPRRAPRLAALVDETVVRLQPGPVQVFVAPHDALNAYTFGLSAPKVLVLHSALLDVMDEDELRFVLGHELGHVALGHTWLNSLVGGMAGIPSPFVASVLLSMAFLWWNRACEFSADRAGLLACGDPQKAITALTKLTIGRDIRSPAELERALRHVDAEDDHVLSGLGEALSTHPMTIRRIEQLRRYAASGQYRRLQTAMEG
jgi:Zn-dependent protease with chaperone function